MQFQSSLLRSWTEVDQLKHEWNDLLESSDANSIFLTWEWLQSWRFVTDDAACPFVIIVRDQDSKLVGVAAYYVATLRFLKTVNFRTLRSMADYATGFEYGDWIVSRKYEKAVSLVIAEAFLEYSDAWDTIWMPSLRGWSGTEQRIASSLESVGITARTRPITCSMIKLPNSFAEYESCFSSKRRQQNRRLSRKVLSEDAELVSCDSAGDLDVYLEALFDLHYKRWSEMGELGCFRRKPFEEQFYRHFIPVALKEGWLRLIALQIGGEFQAIQIGYDFAGVYHQVQEGFNPNFKKASGLGNVLRYHAIESCINDKINEYDFLAGEGEHKNRWQATIRYGFDLFATAPKTKNKVLNLGNIWPTGRFMDQMDLLHGRTES